MSRKSTDSNRFHSISQWNRTLSIRSSKSARSTTTTASSTASHDHHHHQHGQHSRGSHRFSLLNSLRNRSSRQPTPAKRLHRLIKTFSGLVGAHEQAARARLAMAEQLAEWGEERQHHHDQHDQQLQQHHMGRDGDDEAVADVSDKIGVLLAELGEQEGRYAAALEGRCRAALKSVRDTERGVGPAREAKARLAGEIARLKAREPQSARLVTLEQQLVRAEAEGLVGEAQVANVTRQKFKEAYTAEFLATIERAEKQIILSRHGLRLLQLIDDTPVVPGDVRPPYAHAAQARQILNDAEDDLRDWRLGELLGDDFDSLADGDTSEPLHEEGKVKGKGKETAAERRSVEDGGGAYERDGKD